MSIPVDLDKLGSALDDFGAGYLLTVSGDGDIKVVTVEPDLVDGVLHTPPSKGSARNLADNPKAALVFPPKEYHGFSLIIDGTATAGDDAITMTPTAAVLHRPASHAENPTAPGDCQNDCRRLT